MKYIKQAAIIAGISFLGELLSRYVPVPLPASIWGIAILFALLMTGIIKVSDVKETSDFLLSVMTVLFIPVTVAVINVWDIVGDKWYKYLIIVAVSYFVIMFVSGRVTQLLSKRRRGNG